MSAFEISPTAMIWHCRAAARASLVAYARERLAQQLDASGAGADQIAGAAQLFDPEVLTLGFARRFATYKRPNLLLQDPERLIRLLTNAERPVQLVLAGKAHPADLPAQALIREWVRFVRRDEVRPHAIFLSDYDMLMTERLVEGVDVWINTPRRPWEACGTSGMKVLVNGGLNLSELDGWWAEAYSPNVGWALGDGREHDDDPALDALEAAQLYDLLESQVIRRVLFARREQHAARVGGARARKHGEPDAKIFGESQRSRVSGARLSSRRGRLPAAIAEWRRTRRGDQRLAAGARARLVRIALRQREIRYLWRIASLYGGGRMSARSIRDAVCVEICADAQGDGPGFRQPMTRLEGPSDGSGMRRYGARVPATRDSADYTPRIVASHPGVSVPLEAPYILWQR